MLLGEEDERVVRNGHARLSTFGIGVELDRSAWLSVHRQLVAAGLLEVEAEHGGLRLAPDAGPLLREERTVRLRHDLSSKPARGAGGTKDRARRGRSVDALLEAPADRDLFEALRQRRLELARERGVPPYVIFHDRTLIEMVKSRRRRERRWRRSPEWGRTSSRSTAMRSWPWSRPPPRGLFSRAGFADTGS